MPTVFGPIVPAATYAHIKNAGASNAVKQGPGKIKTISLDKWVTVLVVDFYDALTVTGSPIKTITLTATDTGPQCFPDVDVPFGTGLTVNLSAAADIGITFGD